MIEFTCCICGNKYNSMFGEPEERMCYSCLEYDDITDDEDEKEYSKTNYNLIQQRVDREDYRIGWKEKDNG